MSLAIIVDVSIAINVAPNTVGKIRIHIQVFQLFLWWIPSSRRSFAKDGTSQPIAFDRLMFHLATLPGDSSIQDLRPSLTLSAGIDINTFSIQRTNLKRIMEFYLLLNKERLPQCRRKGWFVGGSWRLLSAQCSYSGTSFWQLLPVVPTMVRPFGPAENSLQCHCTRYKLQFERPKRPHKRERTRMAALLEMLTFLCEPFLYQFGSWLIGVLRLRKRG